MTSWSSRVIIEMSFSRWGPPKCKNYHPFPTIEAHIISGEMSQPLSTPTPPWISPMSSSKDSTLQACQSCSRYHWHVMQTRRTMVIKMLWHHYILWRSWQIGGSLLETLPPASSSSSSESQWQRVLPSSLSLRCWRAITHWSSMSSVILTFWPRYWSWTHWGPWRRG